MLKDITLGQYYPMNSFVHRIDPRIKILTTILYIVMIFCIQNPIGFFCLFVCNLALVFFSKLRILSILNAIKPVLFLVVFTAVINIFLTNGNDYLFKWKYISITYTGVKAAILMAIRIVLLVSFTSILTFTTSPIRLTDGIEALLKPFSKLGLPSHELAMMMTIALRFIPTLLEETDKIILAQKSRGADFESGNLIKRSKSLIPILVPLFINSFRRADELATAMECRCYRGGENRTKLQELHIKRTDVFYLFFVVLLFCGILLIGA